jgi:phage tail-like protein
MAIINPRKKFKYRVTFLTLPQLEAFAVQEITLADSEIEVVEHGFGNTYLKTAGMVKPGTVSLTRILGAAKSSISGEIWEWAKIAQDPLTQSGGDPITYKRVLQVDELANDGQTALDTWYMAGAWPSTINGREFSATDSANTVETFELTVDYISQNIPI